MTYNEEVALDQLFRAGGTIVIDKELCFESGSIFLTKSIVFATGAVVKFCGGKLKNETTSINIRATDITIIAGPEQIFEGPFKFKNRDGSMPPNWTMERAYPQWFGAKDCAIALKEYYEDAVNGVAGAIASIDAIADSSAAINAAIKLKQRGEVFIPKGWYKISSHINVLPGIQLRGEATSDSGGFNRYGTMLFPWLSAGTSSYTDYRTTGTPADTHPEKDVDNIAFPLHPNNVNWYNNANFRNLGIESGYMILANISSQCHLSYGVVDTGVVNYPTSIEYEANQGFTSPELEIANITIMDLNDLCSINFRADENNLPTDWDKANFRYKPLGGAKDYRGLRGILSAYNIKLTQVKMCGFSQLLQTLDCYSDQREIAGCVFHPAEINKYAGRGADPDTGYFPEYIEYLYPEKIYAFDIHSAGDALVFDRNHAVDYCSRIGALRLHGCNGGSIRDNILNSDSLIERSNAIDFSSNHIEYGAKLSISSAGVAVRNNYFWKGNLPAISIYRFSVEGYLYGHSQVELDSNTFFHHWHVVDKVSNDNYISPYDIATDGYSSILINNSFRTSSKQYSGLGLYTGLKVASFRLSVDDNILTEGNYTELEEFSYASHLTSIRGNINGLKVTPMSATLRKSDFDANAYLVPRAIKCDGGGWQATANRAYAYKLWIFADYRRKLLFRGPISGDMSVRPPSDKCVNILIGKGDNSDFDFLAGPFFAYIERSDVTTGSPQDIKYVKIPICSTTRIFDDGVYINGYKWASIEQSKESAFASANMVSPLQVIFNGRNVDCLLASMPHTSSTTNLPNINGTWQEGDIIRVGNGTNPAPQWVRTENGWAEI